MGNQSSTRILLRLPIVVVWLLGAQQAFAQTIAIDPPSLVGRTTDSATVTVELPDHDQGLTVILESIPGGYLTYRSSSLYFAPHEHRQSTTVWGNLVTDDTEVTAKATIAGTANSATTSVRVTKIYRSFNIQPPVIDSAGTQVATGLLVLNAPIVSFGPPLTIDFSQDPPNTLIINWPNGNVFMPGQSEMAIEVRSRAVTAEDRLVTVTAQPPEVERPTIQASVLIANPNDMGPCERYCEINAGRPINLGSGNVWIQQRDYSLPGLGDGLGLVRTWNSLWQTSNPVELAGMFGHSWRSTYEERLAVGSDPLRYSRADGSIWKFHFDSTAGVFVQIAPANGGAGLEFDTITNLYTMTFRDGTQKIFNNSGYLTDLIDRNGNRVSISYDGSDRISQVTDAANRAITFTYSNPSSRQVLNVQDVAGTIATYTYDGNAHLTRVSYPDTSFISYAYDSSNQITSVTDTDGKTLETHTYDATRRGLTSARALGADAIRVNYLAGSTQVTDSQSHTTTYNHQFIGGQSVITSISGPGCASCGGRGNHSFGYDLTGNRTSSTDALNRTTNFTYDPVGNVTSRSIRLDVTTVLTWSYTYNDFGEVLTATDPLDHTTTNTYDLNGNLLTSTTPSPDGILPGSTTTFTYDAKGQLITITDPNTNDTNITYTSAGLIETITDAQSKVTKFEYDSRGNRTAVIQDAGTGGLAIRTTFEYDGRSRLKKINHPTTPPGSTTFAYDTRGRRTSVTDANGKATLYTYDDADRLTKVTDAQSPATGVTQYGYDTENNLTSITDAMNPGRMTSFQYDAFGRVTKVTFPSLLFETYGYDMVGNLTSKTDRKNQMITYNYDALDRLTRKVYPDTTSVNYTYDGASRLTEVTDATGTYQFTYDDMGRLTRTTTRYAFLTGRNFSISYDYDPASNRTSMIDPESGGTTYVYDVMNRLSTLTNPQSQQFTFGYDALDRRISLARPNTVNTTYQYDSLSRLLSISHQRAATTLDGTSYTVDALGNLTAKTDLPGNVTSNYTYDPIYQLKQVTQGVSTTESYTYDLVGNRLSSLGVSPYMYDSSNRLTYRPGVTYTYDNNGNLASKGEASGTTTYAWDFENRLTRIILPGSGGTVSFKYDPMGRRIQKLSFSGTSIYLYDGANVIAEVDTNGNQIARYTQNLGVDDPLAETRAGTTSFYQADGLGSITSLTDSTGAIANTYTYDSYGKPTASTGIVVNPFRYTGREYDSEAGLYYYRARYYDPGIGRFLSEDPVGFAGGINFFVYTLNNPVNWLDPFGLEVQVCQRPLHVLARLNAPPHTFLYSTKVNRGWGLGPKWGALSLLTRVPGIIENDFPYDASGRLIPPYQCNTVSKNNCVEDCVIRKALAATKKPPTYILGTYQCNDWADDVLRQCGRECKAPPNQ